MHRRERDASIVLMAGVSAADGLMGRRRGGSETTSPVHMCEAAQKEAYKRAGLDGWILQPPAVGQPKCSTDDALVRLTLCPKKVVVHGAERCDKAAWTMLAGALRS